MAEENIMRLYKVFGYWNEGDGSDDEDMFYVVASDPSEAEKLALDLFDKVISIHPIASTNLDDDKETSLMITLDILKFIKMKQC